MRYAWRRTAPSLAVALPFGILPKVNDAGEPLEKISDIWRIYEEFGVDEAEFAPFCSEKDKGISASDDRVKVSAYKKENATLAVLSITDKSLSLEFDIKSSFKEIRNAFTDEVISSNGFASLKLSGFDYIILYMK